MDNGSAQRDKLEGPLLTRRQLRLLGYAALCVVLTWLLVRCRSVFPVFVLGFLLAYLFDPLLDRLQERGWTRPQATILVFGVLMVCLAIVALLLVPVVAGQVSDLTGNFGVYADKLNQTVKWAEGYAERLGASERTLAAIRDGWQKLAD